MLAGTELELVPVLAAAPNEKRAAPGAAGWIVPDDNADDVVPADDPEPPNVKDGADPPNVKDGAEDDATVELDPAAPKENTGAFGSSGGLDDSKVWLVAEVEGAGAGRRLSSSSSSLLPDASRPTSTFLSGHWNLVGTPALRASAFF